MSNADYLAVIAIDFGTTYSGYAFSMRSSKHDIKMNKSWGAEVGFQSYKTPTSVLLNPDGRFKAFGFQAENEFLDLRNEEIQDGYLLFQRFKMELYKHKELDSNIKIKSTSGEEKPAIDITAQALAFLKNHCITAISKSLTRSLTGEDIRWVITVPAIWSDTAKKFMRLAAKKAGLVDRMMSDKLVIALEPEAASLYCKTLGAEAFRGMEEEQRDLTTSPGDTYIIVDCGGGTIDITVHRCLASGTVEEVQAPSGGPWGGIYVDRRYYQLLDDLFGTDFMNCLKRDHPSAWLNMVVDFEIKKRALNMANKSGINLAIGYAFIKQFEKHSGEDIAERIKKKQHLGVRFLNGMLRVSNDTVANMHDDVIPQIRARLRQLLHDGNSQDISKMFIVGGFAESDYLQEFLISEFGDEVEMLIPEEAGMCVMKGAVLFGHDAHEISSRIARFHYSIPGYASFDPKHHDPSRMVVIQGEKLIRILDRYVTKGQRLEAEEVIERERYPATALCTDIEFELCCHEEETDHPGHPSLTSLEKISVCSPHVAKRDRGIRVSLRFGGTDILFKAVDLESGNETSSTVHF